MSGSVSVEEFRKHLKVYWYIFATLIMLTGVTVYLGYHHVPFAVAVTVALLVATIKGSLVALYFMHLIDEKPIIYSTIGLTAVLFTFLMAISFF